ncbi:hypothetical protein [Paraburkholderia sp. BL9I2N2]|uniref:hypothetical protein n=1 Tax=Paraburkholderia sp. BL9I2N2 TaxID=1938809 RepID=UPI0010470650|nr:hypothetical protein [Paraburkholderia sp. BL9I2N2]TCK92073.1 hypothetical protein B0G74_5925 [Paraburkholderia sp. BL9I2N2]
METMKAKLDTIDEMQAWITQFSTHGPGQPKRAVLGYDGSHQIGNDKYFTALARELAGLSIEQRRPKMTLVRAGNQAGRIGSTGSGSALTGVMERPTKSAENSALSSG